MVLGIIIFIVLLWVLTSVAYFNLTQRNIYVFPKTGNHYKVIGHGKLKNPDTGEWHECVFYQALYDKPDEYARERQDFYKKFVPLKKWKEQQKQTAEN